MQTRRREGKHGLTAVSGPTSTLPSSTRRRSSSARSPDGELFPLVSQPLATRGQPDNQPGVAEQRTQCQEEELCWQGPAGPQEESGVSQVASALQAAKQVTWRGQGELPQMPWSQPHQGLVLVIDLWSGIGGLLVALLALGIRCIALSAEQSDTLRSSVHAHFPHVVHVRSVEELSGEMLRPVLRRRAFSAILIGGGSPCQGNSSLNARRKGWKDPRSQQPLHLARITQEIRKVLRDIKQHIPILQFIENVGSAPADVIRKYADIISGTPVAINANQWGWVHRNRIYWLASSVTKLNLGNRASLQLPDDFSITLRRKPPCGF